MRFVQFYLIFFCSFTRQSIACLICVLCLNVLCLFPCFLLSPPILYTFSIYFAIQPCLFDVSFLFIFASANVLHPSCRWFLSTGVKRRLYHVLFLNLSLAFFFFNLCSVWDAMLLFPLILWEERCVNPILFRSSLFALAMVMHIFINLLHISSECMCMYIVPHFFTSDLNLLL